LLFIAVGCSSVASFATRSLCDWQFVQSVGGIALGKPHRDGRRHVLLPVHCDVSGFQTVTVAPTTINSGIVCESPLVRIRSGTVFLTVRISVASKLYASARCPDADLGVLTAGRYAVIYSSPDGSQHPLGTVQIPAE
jgi:hypothetical protein